MTSQTGRPWRVGGGRATPRAVARPPRRTLGRVLSPELCVLGAILLVLAGVAFSGPPGPDGDAPRDALGRHGSPVEGLAYAPDGRTAASASRDGTVRIWELGSADPGLVVATAQAGFSSVALAPDGRTLVAGQLDGAVTLRDLDTGAATAPPPNRDGAAVRAVAFAPDGRAAASGGDDRLVHVFEVPSGRERLTLRGHASFVQALAFAPDGLTLASAAIDGEAILWDLASGLPRERLRVGPGPLASVAFSADGRSLALGGGGRITLRGLADGRSRSWPTAQGRVTSIRFLPGGAALATSGLDGSIIAWDLSPDGPAPRPRAAFRGHRGGVKALALSPDGATLLSGGNDDAVRAWEVARLPRD